MNQDWILQESETRRIFAKATWVPLRASFNAELGQVGITEIGYINEFFGCGSVAFPQEHRELADRLSWSDIGISHCARPYAYKDGHYSSIDQYQYDDKKAIGVELVFEHRQPVVGGTLWILNPDLVVALSLIKEGNNWVRPEENFVVVVRETLDEKSNHRQIEIKREFLIDYLAARNLSLRLSYYRERVEIVAALEGMKIRKDREVILHFAPYPIHMILGKKDGVLIYDENIDQIEGTKVQLSTFPDGHMSHIENEKQLKKVLIDFLKKV